jgi:hypothetical protein
MRNRVSILGKGVSMRRKRVSILHIDSNYQAHYIIVREGSLIHSAVSLEEAISLLKSIKFDLILSEPHKKAFLEE